MLCSGPCMKDQATPNRMCRLLGWATYFLRGFGDVSVYLCLQTSSSFSPLKLCYGLNVPSSKFMHWNANPQCDDIKRWALGRWLGNENGAFKNGISIHIVNLELALSLCFLPCENTSGFSPETECACTLILNFSASSTARNTCWLFQPPHCWEQFLMATRTKTT